MKLTIRQLRAVIRESIEEIDEGRSKEQQRAGMKQMYGSVPGRPDKEQLQRQRIRAKDPAVLRRPSNPDTDIAWTGDPGEYKDVAKSFLKTGDKNLAKRAMQKAVGSNDSRRLPR